MTYASACAGTAKPRSDSLSPRQASPRSTTLTPAGARPAARSGSASSTRAPESSSMKRWRSAG